MKLAVTKEVAARIPYLTELVKAGAQYPALHKAFRQKYGVGADKTHIAIIRRALKSGEKVELVISSPEERMAHAREMKLKKVALATKVNSTPKAKSNHKAKMAMKADTKTVKFPIGMEEMIGWSLRLVGSNTRVSVSEFGVSVEPAKPQEQRA